MEGREGNVAPLPEAGQFTKGEHGVLLQKILISWTIHPAHFLPLGLRLKDQTAPDVKQHVTLLNQRNRDLASQIIRSGVLDVDGVRRLVDIRPANDLLIPAVAYLTTEDRRVFLHFYSSVAHWGYLEEIEKNGNTIWRKEMQAKQQSFEGNHWHFGYMIPSSKQIGILSFTDQYVTVSVHTFKDGTVIDQVKFFYR